MYVIPSIDIKDRRCVKLVGGKVGSGFVVSEDPVSLARFWESQGADILHIVDLDGAIEGNKKNRAVVKRILREVTLPVEVGGGLRTVEDVMDVMDAGARWAIIGTALVEEEKFMDRLVENVSPSRLIIAIDTIRGKVAIRGWTKTSSISPVDLIKEYEKYGVFAFFLTNVEVEGRERGVNLQIVKKIVSTTRTPILYAGGVADIGDLIKLKKAGVYVVVIGSALYRGNFTLDEAKNAVKGA
jgi:phosphoribosylformimino-5-aminoimidazole carboxamide ribotide isomerase